MASWPGVGLVSRVLLSCHGGLRVALGPWAVRCERIGGRSRCGREVGLSSSSKRCTALTEAHTVWQWWNHYHSQLPEGKRALRINLDETAICAFQGGDAEGNVFIDKSVRAVLNVSHGPRRTYLTHVAFVCDDSAVQPHLPQLIIANERTIPQSQLAALRGACPANVHVLRRRSSWVCGGLVAYIVRMLAAALAPFTGTRQPILFLDACRAHLANCVFAACAATGVWPVVVPARMTWLLQPLDTHTFLPYKIRLQQLCHLARVGTADGSLSLAQLLEAICGAIREVLQDRRWDTAFDRDGYGAGQTGVSLRVLRELGADWPPIIPATRPTLAQIQTCFPRSRRPREELVWRALTQAGVAAGGVAVAVASVPAGPRRSLRIQASRDRSGATAVADVAALPTGTGSSSSSSGAAGSASVAGLPAGPTSSGSSVSSPATAVAAVGVSGSPGIITRSRTRALGTG